MPPRGRAHRRVCSPLRHGLRLHHRAHPGLGPGRAHRRHRRAAAQHALDPGGAARAQGRGGWRMCCERMQAGSAPAGSLALAASPPNCTPSCHFRPCLQMCSVSDVAHGLKAFTAFFDTISKLDRTGERGAHSACCGFHAQLLSFSQSVNASPLSTLRPLLAPSLSPCLQSTPTPCRRPTFGARCARRRAATCTEHATAACTLHCRRVRCSFWRSRRQRRQPQPCSHEHSQFCAISSPVN